MNIGILEWVEKSSGGVYQYSLNLLHCLKQYDTNNNYFVFYNNQDFPHLEFEGKNWKTICIQKKPNLVKNFPRKILRLISLYGLIGGSKFVQGEYNEFTQYNIELLICPYPTVAGYYCRIPYIVAIHDFQHKYYPNLFTFVQKFTRDILFKKSAQFSRTVLVDSLYSKEDLIKFYGISKEKIKILPYRPPYYILQDDKKEDIHKKMLEVKKKYELPDNYVFYPAQFWYHKNHIRLIKALHLVKEKYKTQIPAVFVGSDKESLEDVKKTVKKLKIENQITFLGYVLQEEMSSLYKMAIALVMPTFFGPTNIPPLEAFALGCPVIISNVRGIPEQIGEAGILVDPNSVEDIAEAIYKVHTDKNLREYLIEKGYTKISSLSSENYGKQLIEIINEDEE